MNFVCLFVVFFFLYFFYSFFLHVHMWSKYFARDSNIIDALIGVNGQQATSSSEGFSSEKNCNVLFFICHFTFS